MKGLSKNTKTILGVAVVAALGVYLYQRSTGKSLWSNASGWTPNTSASKAPLCNRRERDGSTTQYTSQGGSNPCPYGGVVTR